MGKINVLDTEISNQIAAGEVVERPASVVKELVENSIDAKATKITVEIKNGGNTYIRVTDDGIGMEKDDAVVAFLRHATSKIKTQEDLNAIYTLGFRGEALSSIGAVSQVDLYTKRREDSIGTHTICSGGEIESCDDACVDGTTFVIKNLFFNVPARRKFLKKDATEGAYITDIVTRFILVHPEISFRLISNNKEVLRSNGDNNLINCVYSVYGKDYAQSMLEVLFESEYVKVTGLCGKPNTQRPNRTYQSYFVNNRYIKSPLVIRAVEEAYKNQIMIGKFPFAILNIEINPALIDINVHPTKLEVKFSNENEIYHACYHAIHEALYKIMYVPKIEKQESNFKKDAPIGNQQVAITEVAKKVEAPKPTVQNIFQKEVNVVAAPKIVDNAVKKEQPKVEEKEAPKVDESVKKAQELLENAKKLIKQDEQKIVEKVREPEVVKEVQKPEIIEEKPQKEEVYYKIVGQLFETYIIIEQDNKMLMIDQHAAHERLNFERLKRQLENKTVYSQTLLIPQTVSVSANEKETYNDNVELFSQMGFDSEVYGENSIIIRSVPIDSVDEEIGDLFIEILNQLEDNKKEILPKKRERLLYSIACKASVKANNKMSYNEQKNLCDAVFELENINTCPHGRPIMIEMTKTEIEKQFKRIV